jgi:hypothetical protein
MLRFRTDGWKSRVKLETGRTDIPSRWAQRAAHSSEETSVTRFQTIRLAWAATVAGVASAFAYLTLMPDTGSLAADIVASVAIISLGSLIGAFAELRVEKTISGARAYRTRETYAATGESAARI